MASAKAIDKIDWTRTLVEEPGLRPTATEAPMPINPMPISTPAAARPTVIFPPKRLSPAPPTNNDGNHDIVNSLLYCFADFGAFILHFPARLIPVFPHAGR